MDEKPYRLRAPWQRYTDVLGGVVFTDSISEPVDERTANRLQAAVGCEILPATDPTPQSRARRGRKAINAAETEQEAAEGEPTADEPRAGVEQEGVEQTQEG